MLPIKSTQCIGFVIQCTILKSCREFDPFAGDSGRSPTSSWYNRLGVKGIVTCPFEAWSYQLLRGSPWLAGDHSCGIEGGEVGGREDPTLLLSRAIVLDDKFIDEDDNHDDDHDEDCSSSLAVFRSQGEGRTYRICPSTTTSTCEHFSHS
jgi:hypothetical protein